MLTHLGELKRNGPEEVLNDLSLDCFCGAKIGVICLNRVRNGTRRLLVSGVEKELIGEVVIPPGFAVGNQFGSRGTLKS
ncbi:MAG TPA: hypothetical protein PK435_15300 [Thermoanaerobaculaceae bacterium]|nr:hypothetical protein [Thermoanaerobaculaceae bacterium]